MKSIIAGLALAALTGCAGTPISQFTHADLQNAANVAEAHGVPQRAAVWRAIDAHLTAFEAIGTAAQAQAEACKAALASLKAPSTSGTVGAATLLETGAELIASGMPANVKALCEPIPIPSLPILP